MFLKYEKIYLFMIKVYINELGKKLNNLININN